MANLIMASIRENGENPEIEDKHAKAVVIAALCHDLGQGPFWHAFDDVAQAIIPGWTADEMAGSMLRSLVARCGVDIEPDVLEAACSFISGKPYQSWPIWLSKVVVDSEQKLCVKAFDQLIRDSNRTIQAPVFGPWRLIAGCRVMKGELTWRLSDIPTVERFLYDYNAMEGSVYQHRVTQAISLMMVDILTEVAEGLRLKECLDNPNMFMMLDDRIMLKMESGQYGEKVKSIAEDMLNRKLYRCVGTIHIDPTNDEAMQYSREQPEQLAEDVSKFSEDLSASMFRVVSVTYEWGGQESENPLTHISFWRKGQEESFKLTAEDVSCISPARFTDRQVRVFVTKGECAAEAKRCFDKWSHERLGGQGNEEKNE